MRGRLMDVRNLRVMEVNETMQKQFEAFCHEFEVEDPADINGIGSMAQGRSVEHGILRMYDFYEGVQRCRDHKYGRNLPEGWVACTAYWLVDDTGVVHGTASLRHALNEFLMDEGGHVGYAIKPSSRGKGYGTHFLHVLKSLAKNKGLDRLLITCEQGNTASRRVIEKNGGWKENEQVGMRSGKMMEHFWIEL